MTAQCSAMSKQTGEQCKLPPIPGASTCRFHGSGTRAAKEAAKRRLATADAVNVMAQFGEPVEDVDPAEAVMEMLRRSVGHVAWLGLQVGDAGASLTQFTGSGAQVPAPMVQLYAEWTDRAGRLAKIAHDMGISERAIRVEEQRGDLMAAGVMWLLGRLGLEGNERARALTSVMFRELAQGRVPQGEVTA